MASERYPENRMLFPPDYAPDGEAIPKRWQRFFDLREELCLNYRDNTARAYWGDLDDWFLWADQRGKDVLHLSNQDRTQYCALLRRRKYSESTVRRRLVTLRLLYKLTDAHSR